ncbi:hypothetical protein LCGC14_3105850, partial [marine sediment metagenome]
DELRQLASPLRGARVAHINATVYGGGVSELLRSVVPLYRALDVKADWLVIPGEPGFFEVTKGFHNALQGAAFDLTDEVKETYLSHNQRTADLLERQYDYVVVHDPQPAPLRKLHGRDNARWVWRCHIDIEQRHQGLWNYLKPFVEQYDVAVLTLKEYAQELITPQVFFMPAIDPFALKNHNMTEAEIDERLKYHGIPTDLPLVVQISRFDEWKDPQGVIEAFQIARKEVDATLVLLGNVALRLGKRIEWDAGKMQAKNCPEAVPLITRPYRDGWTL